MENEENKWSEEVEVEMKLRVPAMVKIRARYNYAEEIAEMTHAELSSFRSMPTRMIEESMDEYDLADLDNLVREKLKENTDA